MSTRNPLQGPRSTLPRYCILILCILVISACSGGCGPVRHFQLAPLGLPHAQQLAAYSQLAPSGDADLIFNLTTFIDTQQWYGPTRAAVALDGDVYVANVDGRSGRRLGTSYPCFDGAVSPDGRWFVCPNETDESHNYDQLQVTSLQPGEWFPTHIVHLKSQGYYSSPTWSPDSRMLAIVRHEVRVGNGCGINIFAGAPPYQTLKHLAELSSPRFLGTGSLEGDCLAPSTLAWSPDGEWLAVGLDGLYLFSIRDALRALTGAASFPVAIDVPASAFTPLTDPTDQRSFAPAWNPHTNVLSYLTSPTASTNGDMWAPQRILTYDPFSQQRGVLATLPLHLDQGEREGFLRYLQHISALAWTPNGQQLLLVVSRSVNCVDCGITYPSQVYMYTPSVPSA